MDLAAGLCGETTCLQVTFLVRADTSSLRSLEEEDAANVMLKKQVDRIRITVIQQLGGTFRHMVEQSELLGLADRTSIWLSCTKKATGRTIDKESELSQTRY